MGDLWLTHAPIDAHVHLHVGGDIVENLHKTRTAGVAAVRDLGHGPALSMPKGRGKDGPMVVSSGPGLGTSGPGSSWLAEKLSGPDQMAQAVEKRVAAGAGVIKLFATGLLDFEHPGQVLHSHALTSQEMLASVEAAHAAGLKVAAHVSGDDSVRRAVSAGVDSIEHGFFMKPATLELLADRKVFWVPTLAAVLAHLRDQEARHAQSIKDNLAVIAESQMQTMRFGEELGIRLAVGTDAGSYGIEHGLGLYTEIQAWLDAQISPYTVYRGVTEHAASLMNAVSLMGKIKKTGLALLLGTKDNPEYNPLIMIDAQWRNLGSTPYTALVGNKPAPV